MNFFACVKNLTKKFPIPGDIVDKIVDRTIIYKSRGQFKCVDIPKLDEGDVVISVNQYLDRTEKTLLIEINHISNGTTSVHKNIPASEFIIIERQLKLKRINN